MADRGPIDQSPQQDLMRVGKQDDAADATYRDAAYLGTDEGDEEEVRDLGFIVEDHDDRRALTLGNWQRVDDLDTEEPLESGRGAALPGRDALVERGVPADAFATDFHRNHAAAEEQGEDFVETSLLETDPDANAGADDFTGETLLGDDGEPLEADILGGVPGAAPGLGSSLPQDIGAGGFRIHDAPDR